MIKNKILDIKIIFKIYLKIRKNKNRLKIFHIQHKNISNSQINFLFYKISKNKNTSQCKKGYVW